MVYVQCVATWQVLSMVMNTFMYEYWSLPRSSLRVAVAGSACTSRLQGLGQSLVFGRTVEGGTCYPSVQFSLPSSSLEEWLG